jgi:uncharacterized repeat protein (TIGR01451 family)
MRVLSQTLAFLATASTLGVVCSGSALAQTVMTCNAPIQPGALLTNQATYRYTPNHYQKNQSISTGQSSAILSPRVEGQVLRQGELAMVTQGVRDDQGQLVFGVSEAVSALQAQLVQQGLGPAEALQAATAGVDAWLRVDPSKSVDEVVTVVVNAIAFNQPSLANTLPQMRGAIALALMGVDQTSLRTLGIDGAELSTITTSLQPAIGQATSQESFGHAMPRIHQAAIAAATQHQSLLSEALTAYAQSYTQMRSGQYTPLQANDVVYFHYELSNVGTAPVILEVPTLQALQADLVGSGQITGITLNGSPAPAGQFSLPPGSSTQLAIAVQVTAQPTAQAPLAVNLANGCNQANAQQQVVAMAPISGAGLVDPLGRVTACDGGLLPDYRGFKVGLYTPADAVGNVGSPVLLTQTELPDIPNNGVPAGLAPNAENSNPFFLTNSDQGQYNFLLDVNRGQLSVGSTYILMVTPPAGSRYSERRIRLTIDSHVGDRVDYTATSLDGQPVNSTTGETSVNGVLTIANGQQVGLALAVLDLAAAVCDAQAIQITKMGDRAAAEPGDTVIYRLAVRNLASVPLQNLTVSDTLPQGFQLIETSVKGAMGTTAVPVEMTRSGSTISFQVNAWINQGDVVTIAYAAQLTPDSMRGTGRNSALASAQRTDNNQIVKDGPAVHQLLIQPGIVSDCGTLIGRVFEDHNFDGEQQAGEPGIPNAVIFMDDGNRIMTDDQGLFSVANVLPGHRTGALDLTSVPGYTLAPNHAFIEGNSESRLVNLAPGGLVRMNFAVMPIPADEADQP